MENSIAWMFVNMTFVPQFSKKSILIALGLAQRVAGDLCRSVQVRRESDRERYDNGL